MTVRAARAVPAGAVLLGVLLAGCTAAPAPPPPPVPPPPPAPPAACLLDVAALRTATGPAWVADETAATDTRCVYDPEGATAGEFVVVEVGPAVVLDDVAAVCADGTRTPTGTGFTCRLPGGGVFAATLHDGDLVTVAAVEVPASTTPDRLATALGAQLPG